MARIRSYHPGIYTDEAWASVSVPARWLGLGLCTEADDNGVFDWKPLQIKMRIFPADAVDVPDLLAELATAGIVKQFQAEGKNLGAIRNFCRYQRPRKPKSWFPLPDNIKPFVAHGVVPKSEPNADEVTPVPQKSELDTIESDAVQQKSGKSPQMEDGGCRREDERGRKKEYLHQHQRTISDAFDRFWAVYPKREGGNPKAAALKEFAKALESGIQVDDIVEGAKAYAHANQDLEFTRFIPHAANWLARHEWADYVRYSGQVPELTTHHFKGDDPRLLAWDAYSVRTRGKGYPRDRDHGWRFPSEWPPDHPGISN